MPDGYEDVVEHVRAHAGDTLQAIVVYDGTRHRDVYRRENVDDLHDSGLEADLLADIRADRRRRESPEASEYEGEHRASADVFEEE